MLEVDNKIAAAVALQDGRLEVAKATIDSWADGLMAGGVGVAASGGGGKQLNSPKDTNVEKMTETQTRAHFLQWRESLELHLETVPTWSGSAAVLRKVQNHKHEMSRVEMAMIFEAVGHETGYESKYNIETFNYEKQAHHMFTSG